jgi:mono/diheme cytochrome c family protein
LKPEAQIPKEIRNPRRFRLISWVWLTELFRSSKSRSFNLGVPSAAANWSQRPLLETMKKILILFFAVFAPAAFAVEIPSGASPQVISGGNLYKAHCVLCHGVNGRDAVTFPRPIWGPGQDIKKFQTAKGLFEYLQMLMPFDDPNKIGDAEKTAITSFLMVKNGDLPPASNLPVGGNSSPIK